MAIPGKDEMPRGAFLATLGGGVLQCPMPRFMDLKGHFPDPLELFRARGVLLLVLVGVVLGVATHLGPRGDGSAALPLYAGGGVGMLDFLLPALLALLALLLRNFYFYVWVPEPPLPPEMVVVRVLLAAVGATILARRLREMLPSFLLAMAMLGVHALFTHQATLMPVGEYMGRIDGALLAMLSLLIWIVLQNRYFRALATRKREALEAQKQLEQVMAAATDTALIWTDLRGRVTGWNSGAERLTGYAASEMIGLQGPELLHDPSELRQRLEALSTRPPTEATPRDLVRALLVHLGEGHWEAQEWSYLCKDGSRKRVRLSLHAVHSPTGEQVGFLGVAQDHTELKRLQDVSRQQARLETLGEMSGRLVHDLNNIVSTISMSSEYLQLKLEQNPEAISILKNIQGATATMQALAKNFSSFGRRKSAIERFPLAPALAESLELARHGVESEWLLELKSGAGLEQVQLVGSMADLQNALLNLILNARDALASAGRSGGSIELVAVLSGESVLIAVDDDGPGVPEELRLRIFEPFYTTKGKGKGTGLGLASVWKTAESLGGTVACERSPQGGARFVMRLPVAR